MERPAVSFCGSEFCEAGKAQFDLVCATCTYLLLCLKARALFTHIIRLSSAELLVAWISQIYISLYVVGRSIAHMRSSSKDVFQTADLSITSHPNNLRHVEFLDCRP
jgi:hypothetical protein